MSQMTPYGYRIVRGEAVTDSEEALNLRTFFKLFLQGFTVEDARHDAGIKMSLAAVGNDAVEQDLPGGWVLSPHHRRRNL